MSSCFIGTFSFDLGLQRCSKAATMTGARESPDWVQTKMSPTSSQQPKTESTWVHFSNICMQTDLHAREIGHSRRPVTTLCWGDSSTSGTSCWKFHEDGTGEICPPGGQKRSSRSLWHGSKIAYSSISERRIYFIRYGFVLVDSGGCWFFLGYS